MITYDIVVITAGVICWQFRILSFFFAGPLLRSLPVGCVVCAAFTVSSCWPTDKSADKEWKCVVVAQENFPCANPPPLRTRPLLRPETPGTDSSSGPTVRAFEYVSSKQRATFDLINTVSHATGESFMSCRSPFILRPAHFGGVCVFYVRITNEMHTFSH